MVELQKEGWPLQHCSGSPSFTPMLNFNGVAINEAQSDENDQPSWYCWSMIHDISLQFNTRHLFGTMCNMSHTVAIFLNIGNTFDWIQSFLFEEMLGIAKCKGNASYKCYSFLQQCVPCTAVKKDWKNCEWQFKGGFVTSVKWRPSFHSTIPTVQFSQIAKSPLVHWEKRPNCQQVT